MNRERLPAAFQPRTIPGLLAARAAAEPAGLAVIAQSQGVFVELTHRELADESARTADALRSRYDVEPGTRVAWLADNRDGASAIVLFHAVAAAAATNVPLNPRFVAREVTDLVERSGATILVYAAGSAGLAAAAARGGVRAVSFAELAEHGSGARVEPRVEPDEDAVASILFTSGTTAAPKGVVHTHGSSVAAGIAWADAFRLLGHDVYHSPFPIFSGAGLHFSALATLWAGATNVIDTPDTAGTLERIERFRSTVYAAVPSIYQYWLEEQGLVHRDLSSLRLLDYGGATMPLPVILALRRALPGVRLMQTYGLTEAGPGGLYLPEEYAEAKLGSIGNRGAGGARFRVVSEATGREAAAGELGELELKGPSLMLGYHDDVAATQAVLTDDGWLKTGDLVQVDEQGFVFHVDRKKDIIVRGGFNVGSAEVESVLLEHPHVIDAAAVGRPHATLGEEVGGVVVLREQSRVDEAALIAHCAERLADFKVPVAVAFVDRLPRNAAGKVRKDVLRSDASLWETP